MTFMAKKFRTKPKTTEELAKTIRRDWGNVNPVTRIMPDKTKYNRKQKHKKGDFYD